VSRLVGLMLLCLALTACGDGGDESYKQDFPPIDRGLVALGDEVESGLRSADDATLATRFAGYAQRLGRLRRQLSDLEPPDSLRKRHEALVAATRATRSDLDAIARAAREADAAAAKAAATALVRDGARLEEARREIADAL
jgi:hypothetical protein